MSSPQDFVDQMNARLMPELGYVLRKVNGFFFWCWPSQISPGAFSEVYPADEAARRYAKQHKNAAGRLVIDATGEQA